MAGCAHNDADGVDRAATLTVQRHAVKDYFPVDTTPEGSPALNRDFDLFQKFLEGIHHFAGREIGHCRVGNWQAHFSKMLAEQVRDL